MILFEKSSREASKHSHYPQFVFRVRKAGTRVEYDFLYAAFTSYPSSSLVTRPQISMDKRRSNTLSPSQVSISQQPWNDLLNNPIKQEGQVCVTSVIFLDKVADSAEAVFCEEFWPGTTPRIILGSAANVGLNRKAENRSGKSFRNQHRGAVQFCKLLSKR